MRTSIVLALALLACSSSTAPDNPGPEVEPVVGAWCPSSPGPTVTRVGSDWVVNAPLDRTTYRDVRRSDGVVVRQEVRECVSRTCTIADPGNLLNAAGALRACIG